MNFNNSKESSLVATLLRLTSEEKIKWRLENPRSSEFQNIVELHNINYIYTTKLGEARLILFDRRESRSNSISSAHFRNIVYGNNITLTVFSGGEDIELLTLNGSILSDLYGIVHSKTGSPDRVLDDLINSAKNLL